MAERDTEMGSGPRAFPETSWTMIAGIQGGGREREAGLQALCERYWRAIYCYLRQGLKRGNEEAKELTQAFFIWLLEGEVLDKYSAERASFRFVLKGLLRNFVSNEDQARRRVKRGGEAKHLALGNDDDVLRIEELLQDEKGLGPEEAFDLAWVHELLERAVEQLKAESEAGQGLRWKIYEAYELSPPGEQPTYGSVAEALSIKPSDVRNHLFAARERLRALVREELKATVRDEAQLEDEWRMVFAG